MMEIAFGRTRGALIRNCSIWPNTPRLQHSLAAMLGPEQSRLTNDEVNEAFPYQDDVMCNREPHFFLAGLV